MFFFTHPPFWIGLTKGAIKTIQNETKEQKGGLVGMFLGALSASLLQNLLTGKGTIRAGGDPTIATKGF